MSQGSGSGIESQVESSYEEEITTGCFSSCCVVRRRKKVTNRQSSGTRGSSSKKHTSREMGPMETCAGTVAGAAAVGAAAAAHTTAENITTPVAQFITEFITASASFKARSELSSKLEELQRELYLLKAQETTGTALLGEYYHKTIALSKETTFLRSYTSALQSLSKTKDVVIDHYKQFSNSLEQALADSQQQVSILREYSSILQQHVDIGQQHLAAAIAREQLLLDSHSSLLCNFVSLLKGNNALTQQLMELQELSFKLSRMSTELGYQSLLGKISESVEELSEALTILNKSPLSGIQAHVFTGLGGKQYTELPPHIATIAQQIQLWSKSVENGVSDLLARSLVEKPKLLEVIKKAAQALSESNISDTGEGVVQFIQLLKGGGAAAESIESLPIVKEFIFEVTVKAILGEINQESALKSLVEKVLLDSKYAAVKRLFDDTKLNRDDITQQLAKHIHEWICGSTEEGTILITTECVTVPSTQLTAANVLSVAAGAFMGFIKVLAII